MRIFSLATLASVAFCSELKLELRTINGDEIAPLGVYEYNIDNLNASVVEAATGKENHGIHCVDATFDGGSSTCFSFLEIESPLHYNLLIDVDDNQIRKLSLVHNREVEGIIPEVRRPVKGPEAPAMKLRKITKTYQDKKADKKVTTAQFSEEDTIDDKSWLQKNWKILAIGLVVYNVVVVMNKQEEIKQEVEQQRKPLLD
ncbi:YDR056C [Zygosaccharomyces parabailii]|nr:YDR056C [Zygosaccharomyces parabailii]SJM86433.1 uncharacterized protein ZBIST_2849 [Zygosaccharomyces bailii]